MMRRMGFSLVSIYMCIVTSIPIYCQPWGKDADLAFKRQDSPEEIVLQDAGMGIQVSEILINFHQDVISPADGPRSHFEPSSSQYTLDAIHKYGFFYGYAMGCDRLMRENNEEWIYPLVPGRYGLKTKYDPVR